MTGGDRFVDLHVRPLTPERWPDLVRLFGERGACGGCWCMWWRLPRSTFDRQKGGAKLLEGYPVEPKAGRMPDAFAWTGLSSAFREAGFDEVARRSPTRPIMRRLLRPS